MLFTPRSAVSANNPGTSRKAFFRGKKSAVPVPKAKGDGETDNNAAAPGVEAQGEQAAAQQPQQSSAQNTFFQGKNGGGGDTFFAPKPVVAKPAAPAPENKPPEQEQQQKEQETAPLVENETARPAAAGADPPADPPVDPVPPGAHLLFNPEEKQDAKSGSQAESGHKADIDRQMEMETQDARNNLGLDPKSEEGKPTVFEPKNPGEKQGEPVQPENKNGGAPAAQPEGAAAAGQAPQQGNAGKAPLPAKEPAGETGGPAAGGNPEPQPQQEAPDAAALPPVEQGDAVAQIGSLNAVEPTEAELETYLKDPRSDAEKRQQQAGFVASFTGEAAAAEVRINASVATNRAAILAAQSQASEALVAQITAVTARMQAHFAGERQQLAVQMTAARAQLAASKASDLAAADALQQEKATTLTTELASRRDAFNQFVAEQKQQPYVKAAAEADRADGELNAAAATCRQQGNEIAARHNGSDDGDPEARESVLRLARESAEDILSKKAVIREDVMARAADFDGSFGQYQEDTVNQINDIEHQLLPGIAEGITAYKQQIETAYSGIETSLGDIEQRRISQLGEQEQSTMEHLQTLQQNGLQSLEEAAYGSVHALELAGQQTLDAVQELGRQITTLLTPGQGLPDLAAIQSLYDESLAQLQQLETDGTANMQLLVGGAQTQFDGISSQAMQESDTVATQATTATASMLAENESQLAQINTNVVQSMATAAAAITTSLDQMRTEALAGLDQSIEERKGKITQANEEFGTELHTQVDTSIETAKQPLLDVLIDRLLSASYKAKASWWEGLLLAIADFLLILIVIVAIAAVLVYFGVFATIAGALMVIGAIVLAIVFIVSLVSRLASGQGWRGIFYAIFDTIGVTAIYQAITNRDIASGRDLGQSTFDRWFSGTSGVLQLITILSPLKSRIPGVRRIAFPELPGWARFAEWVEGAGASRRGGAPPLWDQFTGKLGRLFDRMFGRTPEPEQRPGDQPADETPAEEQPAEEQPAEEQPAEEQPAEEQPAEEQPAEEQPAEEQPAEEQPAEEQPAEEQPAEEQPEEYDPGNRTTDELRTDIDPTPRAGETVAEAAERARLAREELSVREVMDVYDALGEEPQPFDINANDAANGDAHTVGNTGNPGRHGPDVPLERSLDANGLPDGTRTVEGRIYGDPPWGGRANFSGRWRGVDIINRVINQYLRANWDQIRSDLATSGNHTNAFPAGEVVGDGYYNTNYGTPNPPVARGPVPTNMVRISIELIPGPPPSYFVVTTFPTISGM